MEVAEATALEGAIIWRAQNILETLQLDKLDAWLHRLGLADGIGELKSQIERMETVVTGVKGRAVGNKPLARSLARVKELMYDADDVIDELDYYRIQHQVEGATLVPAIEPEAMVGEDRDSDRAKQADASANTDIPNNSGRKNRSKERDNFRIIPPVNGQPAQAECIDCGTLVTWGHGTSVLRKHLNSARCKNKRKNKNATFEETPNPQSDSDGVRILVLTNDSEGRKRMRTDSNVATTHPWNMVGLSEKINQITLELQSIRGDMIEYLSDYVGSFNQCQSNTSDTRVKTSSSLPGEVYGRDKEKDRIIGVIQDAKSSEKITVLPIVGVLGVGKTTLAKLVYNDPIVQNQFERIWVRVSNVFDEVRVTREILDVVTLDTHEGFPRNKESYEGLSNYSKLQEVLKKHMVCWPKRFFLVLDDVPDCMDNYQWEYLLCALGSSHAKGNVIIVTVRNLSVAQRLGTMPPVKLRALYNHCCELLFKACAFGDNNYQEYLDISDRVVTKLKGNPLAAKNAAEMLREQPTIDHWKSIMEVGVWESLQHRGGIVTALKVTFFQLPYPVQQCFLFCSIFPSKHQFHIDDLVYMWISLGFVKSIEIGRDYFNILVNSGFFEQAPLDESCYIMCGVMYECARLVSRPEFVTIDSFECKEELPTACHASILLHEDNVRFEPNLQGQLSSARRLRSLILIGNCSSLLLQSFNIFMCNSVNCIHLRCVKLESSWSNYEALHVSLSKFYHLELLDARTPAIVDGMDDLVNMRHLVLTKGKYCASLPVWLGNLGIIHLEDCEGWGTLLSLESLLSLTKLKLRNMKELKEVLIPSLEELVLIDMPKLERCSCSSVRARDLNSSLRILEIRGCRVLNGFPLYETCENFEIRQQSWLPHVSEFTIHDCPCLTLPHPLPPSSSFCKLSIRKLLTLSTMEGSSNGELMISNFDILDPDEMMTILDNTILSFNNLKSLNVLIINSCENLMSISLEGFRQLVSLKRLEISWCAKLFSPDVSPAHTLEHMAATKFDALPSLECLSISGCGITGEWLSVLLKNVRALDELHLWDCQQIEGLLIEGKENSLSNLTRVACTSSLGNPDDAVTRSCPNKLLRIPSHLIPSLRKMYIGFCSKLTFLGNNYKFLEELIITNCGSLEGVQSLSGLRYLDVSEISKLESLRMHSCTALEKLTITNCGSLKALEGVQSLSGLRYLEVSEISRLESLRLHSCTALEELRITNCGSLKALEGVQSLHRLRFLEVSEIPKLESLQLYSCTAMEKLTIEDCDSLEALEGVQSLSGLRYLEVSEISRLESLRLHSCTALEKLTITDCRSLKALEGVQFLRCLRFLEVHRCPDLSRFIENLSTQGYELCPRLETLSIDDYSFLTMSFCKHLTSLQSLQFKWCDYRYDDVVDEQETSLPVDLHSLPSLKRLEITDCPSISRLPERGLPPSLEELEVHSCSKELTEQCRMLATSKLTVKINGKYVADY